MNRGAAKPRYNSYQKFDREAQSALRQLFCVGVV
jgi:hypothetical protein